ncbi:hypothetical protein [Poseidonocella sp. HB161398]|uniref:hypothetical protein n=1 Tax=Poseidonocella sp. HB161398 TaxID=2320855 RepID=UPI001109530E|nr:hypothetical protein [Poseidonocella sp. HB161398]
MPSQDTPPPRPKLLGWPTVIGIAVTAVTACIAGYLAFGAIAVPALAGGVLLGMAGTMLGSSGRAAAGGILVLALMLLHLALPAIDIRLVALALPAAAGWETARRGGRAFTLALMSMGLLVATHRAGAAATLSLPLYAAGLAYGLGCARLLKLQDWPAVPAEGLHGGLRHGLFLAIGLALAVSLAGHLRSAHSIWIVQFFVMRGLAPGHMALPSALKFAAGVLAGTAAAILLEMAGLSRPPVSYAIALAALLAGLRSMPSGPPWTPAALTVGLLLMTAPTPGAAVFRGEAALMAAGLAIALATLLGRLIRNPGPPRGQ